MKDGSERDQAPQSSGISVEPRLNGRAAGTTAEPTRRDLFISDNIFYFGRVEPPEYIFSPVLLTHSALAA
jgi:hypothetical protein